MIGGVGCQSCQGCRGSGDRCQAGTGGIGQGGGAYSIEPLGGCAIFCPTHRGVAGCLEQGEVAGFWTGSDGSHDLIIAVGSMPHARHGGIGYVVMGDGVVRGIENQKV